MSVYSYVRAYLQTRLVTSPPKCARARPNDEAQKCMKLPSFFGLFKTTQLGIQRDWGSGMIGDPIRLHSCANISGTVHLHQILNAHSRPWMVHKERVVYCLRCQKGKIFFSISRSLKICLHSFAHVCTLNRCQVPYTCSPQWQQRLQSDDVQRDCRNGKRDLHIIIYRESIICISKVELTACDFQVSAARIYVSKRESC